MIKGLIFLATLFLSNLAFALYEIPPLDKVLIHFGECKQQSLPNTFQLFVWNIKKAEFKQDWAKDFEYFTPRSDLVLIQEAIQNDLMPEVLKKQSDFCWQMMTSFLDNDKFATGVMNGARINPTMVHFLRSSGREPVIKTPKMIAVTEYQIANRLETLWVANIHGLNATSDENNKIQVEEALQFLSKHKGPLIFAGDFNSWNIRRLNILNDLLGKQGLQKLKFPDDKRTFKLDHIYVRGLTAFDETLHSDIKSSDHAPLSATLRLN